MDQEKKAVSANANSVNSQANTSTVSEVKQPPFVLPDIQDFLKAGVQFGHETKKWNPLMKQYIFTSRNNIHIIDISQTMEALQTAANFLMQAAAKGLIMFVGTKRQASEIVKQAAVDCGAMFITHRWPGGLLTNFSVINKSLKKFIKLEEEFETGVVNRTKFEVSKMKKEWERMNRIYEGIKKFERFPEAVVVIDTNYERGVINEAKKMGIPIVAMVDTNCDPNAVEYPIPANDDALKSIELVMGILSQAVKKGNQGKGIKHEFKDFSKFNVQTVKAEEKVEEFAEVAEETPKVFVAPTTTDTRHANKGILEKIQESKSEESPKQEVKKAVVAAVAKKPLPVTKKVVPTKEKTKPAKTKTKTKVKAKITKKPAVKTKAKK